MTLLYSVNLTEGTFHFVHGQSNFIAAPCFISWQIRPASLIDGSKRCAAAYRFLSEPNYSAYVPWDTNREQYHIISVQQSPPVAFRAPVPRLLFIHPIQYTFILNRKIPIGHPIYTSRMPGVSLCSNCYVIVIRSQRRGNSISMDSLVDHAASKTLVRTETITNDW
jgi:hypothetical protein